MGENGYRNNSGGDGGADTDKLEGGKLNNPLKSVNSMHREIMWRDIHGQVHRDIAKILGISEGNIALLFKKNSDGSYYNKLFGNEYEELKREVYGLRKREEAGKLNRDVVRARLNEEAIRSLDELIMLRGNAENERVRQISAMDLLDRAGYKAIEKTKAEVTVKISDEKGDRISKALEEMRKVG